MAQYPGRIKPDEQKKPDEPRAVSILEWVGDPGKPVASRIVPLSVFVNGEYQDGGLFMAQPAPLTVENDTLYELQLAGIPKGTFYVAGGEEVGGAWFGYGKWKPLTPPPPPKKLTPSKVPPKVIQDNDPDRPHLKNSSPGSSSGGSTTPANDPDQPTLHRAPIRAVAGKAIHKPHRRPAAVLATLPPAVPLLPTIRTSPPCIAVPTPTAAREAPAPRLKTRIARI